MEQVIEAGKNHGNLGQWPWLTGVEIVLTGRLHCDYTTYESLTDLQADCETIREVKNYTGFSAASPKEQTKRIADMDAQFSNYLSEGAYVGVIVDWKGPIPPSVAAMGADLTAEATLVGKHFEIRSF